MFRLGRRNDPSREGQAKLNGDQERDYHNARARDELDWSYRATHRAAADAHMQLSALHMKRAMLVKSAED